MWRNGEKIEHPSFGLIQISRVSSNKGQRLFGSSIKTTQTVYLRIMPAHEVRDKGLSTSWFFSHGLPYIEVEMTAAQFADAITSLNMGDGVPCTVRAIGANMIENPPDISRREQHAQELEKTIGEAMAAADRLADEAKGLINGRGALKVEDRKRLAGLISSMISSVKTHVPWIVKQWNKAMDKTVNEGRQEVEQAFSAAMRQVAERAIASGVDIGVHDKVPPQIEGGE